MEQQQLNPKAGQGLGLAGFIVAMGSIILFWIPYFGIFPPFVGLVLSAIAMAIVTKNNGKRGLIIAGLAVSLVLTGIAGWITYKANQALREFKNEWNEGWQDFSDEFKNSMDEADNTNGFESLEDALKDLEDGMKDMAEDMESEFNEQDWDKWIEEGDFDQLLDAYEDMVLEYIEFVKKAEDGDLSALSSYMKVASKLTIFTMKFATIMPKLTEEQIARFNEIDEKYKDYLKE
ncbi:MAG: hypothetical protein ABIJ16_05765 [Bacteroidota bacterium]